MVYIIMEKITLMLTMMMMMIKGKDSNSCFNLFKLFRGKHSVSYKTGTKHAEKLCGRQAVLLYAKEFY